MSTLDHRIRFILHHFRDSGRLNVLIALIAHANIRNRCYPSMRLLAKETGYALEAVNEAKKWLEEHGAIEIVKYQQRVGDELKIKSVRQNVYQLTGVIILDGVEHPYLYVSPTEISVSEISPVEMEVVKAVKVVPEVKETTFASDDAIIDDGTETDYHGISKPSGRIAVKVSASKQDVPPTDATTPPPKVAPKGSPVEGALMLRMDAPVKVIRHVKDNVWLVDESGTARQTYAVELSPLPEKLTLKQKRVIEAHYPDDLPARQPSAKQLEQGARIKALSDCGFAPPLTKSDFSNYNATLKTLSEAAITQDLYPLFVKWVRDIAKSQNNWTVSLNSLASKNRPSEFMLWLASPLGQKSRQNGATSVLSASHVGSMLMSSENASNAQYHQSAVVNTARPPTQDVLDLFGGQS